MESKKKSKKRKGGIQNGGKNVGFILYYFSCSQEKENARCVQSRLNPSLTSIKNLLSKFSWTRHDSDLNQMYCHPCRQHHGSTNSHYGWAVGIEIGRGTDPEKAKRHES